MLTLAVLSGPWPRLGVIAAALLAAGVLVLRRDQVRAWAMLGALVLAPVLLLDDVWHSSQLDVVHRHPAEAAVAAVLILIALAVAARVLWRWPRLLGPLAVVTLPFRVPIQTGGDTANLLLPLYFVIAAAALAWIVPTLRRATAEARPRSHAFELLLAACLVVYALQSLYSHDFEQALQNEVFFYVPFAVLLSLLRSLRWDRQLLARCLAATVALALLFACIGFVEEATKTLFWNPKLVAADQQHRYFEVNSLFYDPNIFGRYLALVMVLVTTVLLYDRRPRYQLASCAVLAILWACLIFTLSRSSLAALAVGLAVLAGCRWRAAPVLALAGVVVVAGAVFVAVRPRTFGLNHGLNHASSGRAGLIAGGVHLFRARPLQGWGSGSFSTEYTRHYPRSARSVSQSHNIAVTVAAEQGVIGLVLYLALVVTALGTLLRGARASPARVAIAAALLALLLHTLLYADFLEDPTTWTLLAIGGALALAGGEVSGAGPTAVRAEPPRELHRA